MSFSSGFAEGLNSVNNIWRTVNNQKYQDESNSLRQADQVMRQREFDQNNQFRQDSLDQQKQFHADEMGLRDKEMQMQQQIASMNQAFRSAQLGMEQYRNQMAELQPVWQGAIQILSNGGEVPAEVLDKLSGTPFDLGAMSGMPYRSAVKSITDALSKNPDQLNSADNLRNLNTVLAPELKRGVGEVDPGNGKTVAGRELTGVIPSPDGKLISPKIKLTYSDGSTAEGPLSKFGTTHPDDPLIAIPKEAAGQQMFARAAASALISSSPNAKALGGAGKNTVRQQVAGKIADLEEKRVESDSKLRAGDIGGDVATHKTVLDNINANDKQYQDLEQHLYSIYGVNSLGAERTSQGGDDAQRQQMMADNDYPGFKQVMTDKKWDVDKIPTDQLSSLLDQYKQSLAKNVKATSMADQMRQTYEQNSQ
ncbi:hypothetical protein P7U51_000656 [Citrobacter freundii]|uniref:Uncharacterized protein n=1 Tax=Citrobacter freundii TaxID=546 RepID=A0AAN4EQT9_CITFR|nr:hypothetical protein [Citrobacter freundii]